jgi:hypothetical protein
MKINLNNRRKMKYKSITVILLILFIDVLVLQSCGSDSPNNSNNNPSSDPNNQIILRQSSEHFNYYCVQNDVVVLDTISTLMESAFDRLTTLLNYQINDTIDVYIYPDLETFQYYSEWPSGLDPPDWFVGQCVDKDVIRFASPLNPGSVHTYETVLQASVHEFAHAFNLQILRSRNRIPLWLFEGFASFGASYPLPYISIIRQYIVGNNLPSLDDLDNDQNLVEGNLYSFSYTIVEYIVDEYGYENLSEFLKFPGRYEEAFGSGITAGVFQVGWHEFLIANY